MAEVGMQPPTPGKRDRARSKRQTQRTVARLRTVGVPDGQNANGDLFLWDEQTDAQVVPSLSTPLTTCVFPAELRLVQPRANRTILIRVATDRLTSTRPVARLRALEPRLSLRARFDLLSDRQLTPLQNRVVSKAIARHLAAS
jgi:hypothetical protein